MRFLLILLLLITIPVQVTSSDFNEDIKITEEIIDKNYLDTNQIIEPETHQLDVEGNLSGTNHLEFGDQYTSIQSPEKGNLGLDFEDIYLDRLHYRTNFSEAWNISDSKFQPTFNHNDKTAQISGYNLIGPENHIIPFNIPIENDVLLDFSMEEFDFTSDENSELGIAFEFDTITIKFKIVANGIFNDFYKNESIQLSLDWDTPISRINLSNYFDENYFPQVFETIKISSYKSTNYNYSITFNEIGVLEKQNEMILKENNQEIIIPSSLIIEINEDETISLQIVDDIIVTIVWNIDFTFLKIIEVGVEINENKLIGNTSFIIEEKYINFTLALGFDKILSNYSVSYQNSELLNDQFIISINEPIELDITGELVKDSNNSYLLNNLKQGKNTTLSVSTGNYRVLYLHHHKQNKIAVQQLTHSVEVNETSVVIPNTWGKGEISIFILKQNFEYLLISSDLQFSPSTLDSPDEFRITRGQQVVLPVFMQNITSGESYNATRIVSYLNGSLRSVDNIGVLIGVDEFEIGTTILFINATKEGLIPQEFHLTIHVDEIDLSPSYTTQRTSKTSAIVDLELLGMNNISSQAILYLINDVDNQSFTIHGVYSDIILENQDWEEESQYQFDAIIEFGDAKNFVNFTINIPIFQQDSNFSTILTITTFTGIMGGIGYRMYKVKFGEEVINF